jgi:succinate-semialdehyde dehydrogenase/glutarate-semialdehyde dehydrogenase
MKDTNYISPALYIDGEWISETGQSMPIMNPATGKQIGTLPLADAKLVERALTSADKGFAIWSKTPHEERAAIMKRAAGILRANMDRAVTHLTMEMGKPVAEARVELENCAVLLEWTPDEAAKIADRVLTQRAGWRDLRVRYEPIGTVAAFAPWNFPASLATRKVVSALAVGCAVMVRPPEETPAAFAAVAQALHEAGLPKGVLTVLYGDPDITTYPLIDSPVVKKIAFTGSTHVGSLLAKRAGARAKPSVMELGGHAPVIICGDADIPRAAQMSVASKYRNSGQVCVSPTRFYIDDAVYDDFTDRFVTAAKVLRLGDGLDPDTQMGPLAHDRRIDAVHGLVTDAVDRGARLLCGGSRMDREGYFYLPTVLADVPIDARIMSEEPFGPVAVLNRFTNLDDALAAANATDFALGAYGFTGSVDTAEKLARDLDAGMVAINSFVVGLVDSPLGGRRASGFGSEGGPEGIAAYVIPKFSSLIEV